MNTFLLLAVLFPVAAHAYHCGCFESVYEKGFYGMMCTNEYIPSRLNGYKLIYGGWFVVDCRQCGQYFSACANKSIEAEPVQEKVLPEPVQEEPEPQQEKDLPVERINTEVTGDPVHCCLYASKEYYYTEQIHTVAPNPEGPNGSMCEGTDLGDQLIGEWYVGSMYNQCFFLTASLEEAQAGFYHDSTVDEV